MDAHKNFAASSVATAPSPASSGTSLTVATADGALFPAVPFNATVWPTGTNPTAASSEIVRVTNISGDVFTITRAQESSSARSVLVGDQIAATITAKTLTDIELAVGPLLGSRPDIQTFYPGAGQTWRKPTSFTPTYVGVSMQGGAGGGGGGVVGATSVSGGAGGGAAGRITASFFAADLGSTENVAVGAGGAGGAGVATGSGTGNPGVDGADSTFGTSVYLTAAKGLGGAAGSSSNSTGGAGGTTTVANPSGSKVNTSGITGGAGGGGTASSGAAGNGTGASGGAGHGVSSGGAGGAGGTGNTFGVVTQLGTNTPAGTGALVPPGPPAVVSPLTLNQGSGGAGGGNTTADASSATVASPGFQGGGGGGGASTTAGTAGSGKAGGDGICVVVTW